MGLISRVSSRTYRLLKLFAAFFKNKMPKRKLKAADLIALDKEKQNEILEKTEEKVKQAKKAKKGQNKNDQSSNLPQQFKPTGILHVKQLPRVLDEQDLREYFSQFGPVRRVKLGRSIKTGNSKGFCFIEFLDRKTADICCKSMQGYLLYNCLLKFKVCYKNHTHALEHIKKVNKEKDENEGLRFRDSKKKNERAASRAVDRAMATRSKTLEKFMALGIDVPELAE